MKRILLMPLAASAVGWITFCLKVNYLLAKGLVVLGGKLVAYLDKELAHEAN